MLMVAVLVGVMVAERHRRVRGTEPFAIGHAGGQRIIPAGRGTRESCGAFDSLLTANAQIGPGGQRCFSVPFARDDIDHSAEGVWTIQAAGRTAMDLEALNGGRVHRHPSGAPLHRTVHSLTT